MNTLEVHVEKVTRFDDPGGQADARVELGSAGAFTVAKKDPRFKVWSQILKDWQASGQPVYVETDAATGAVRNLFLPSPRIIEHVAAQPEDGRLKVVLFMAPSLYHVKTTRADYDALRQKLEDAVKTQQPVLVTSHPDTQEILDVRAAVAQKMDGKK